MVLQCDICPPNVSLNNSLPSSLIAAQHVMDPLSITVSIIAIVKLTGGVIEYFEEVKDASKDRAQCAIEASNLSALLTKLRYRLEEGASNELWNAEVQKLGEKDGILDQYKHALEQLHAAITSRRGIKKTGHLIRWSLIKKKVEVILTRIERLKPLVHIALEMDHMLVFSSDIGAIFLTFLQRALSRNKRRRQFNPATPGSPST
jgi:hypothetical protein